jgi:type VII secretion protein EccB
MASRKDLLKAQSFVHQRMVAALVMRDPDNPATPLRRMRTASFIGILAGVLVMAGFGVAGLLLNGGFSKWSDTDHDLILIDTESGSVYTYRGSDGARQLRPAANITSALLLVSDGASHTKQVKTDSMKGVDILPMQGIPDAPRQLPGPGSLAGSPIRLCSAAPTSGYRPISLEIGQGQVPSQNQAVVMVADDRTTEYLVANGVKHEIHRAAQYARSPIFVRFEQIVPGNRFLNALPTGSPLTSPTVLGAGEKPVVDAGGKLVGDIVSIGGQDDPDSSFYIVLPDGFSRITYIEATLTKEKYQGTVTSDQVAAASSKTSRYSATDIPDGLPTPAAQNNSADASVCAVWPDTTKPPILSVGADTVSWDGTKTAGLTADVVSQVQGSGALLQNEESLSSDSAIFLVVGRHKYPIPDLTSRTALGYGSAPITRVPPQLIQLLPDGLAAGEALNRATADKVIGT